MLRERADLRTVLFVAVYFGLLTYGFTQELTWATGPALSVALCLMSFFCAVATHNTVHAPIFHSKPLNRLFQVALTLCYGHPVSAYVPGHNLSHHRYMQTPRDIMRTSKLRFRWNLLNQLAFSTVVGPAIFKANIDYARAMRTQRPGWYRQFILEAIIYVSFLVGLLVLDWQKFLLFVLIPHQYAAFGIMGINFATELGREFFAQLKGAMHAGAFHGSWTHNPEEGSGDRYRGHRHDQSCASLIAHRLGMKMHPEQVYDYYYQPTMPETVEFALAGL